MASIQRKPNGSYKITVSMGYNVNGDKIRKTTTFRPDESKVTQKTPAAREKAIQKQVEAFARDFEEQCKAGETFDADKITLQIFAEKWLSEVAPQKIQDTTLQIYKADIQKKIIPAIGHYKLSDLKPAVISRFYLSMTKDGCRMDGKPGHYSKGSIQKTARILSSVLATAEQWEIIDRNPCSRASVPNVDNGPEENTVKCLTPEQARTFLEFLEHGTTMHINAYTRTENGHRIIVPEHEQVRKTTLQNRVLLNLALNTGLRRGEIVALQWSDIDTEKHTVSVSKTVEPLNGGEIVKKPKTVHSVRTIGISDSMVQMLKRLKAEQAQYKFSVGDYWTDGGWIFTQDNGTRIRYSYPFYVLKNEIRRYNLTHDEKLPEITFHQLRHTSATALISSGVDVRTVADRLGHSNVTITLNVYSHTIEEKDHAAAELLTDIFTAKRKQA